MTRTTFSKSKGLTEALKIRLDRQTKRNLMQAARAEGTDMGGIVRKALLLYFKEISLYDEKVEGWEKTMVSLHAHMVRMRALQTAELNLFSDPDLQATGKTVFELADEIEADLVNGPVPEQADG